MSETRTVDQILAASGAPTLSYIVATGPYLEKAVGGVTHPTPDAAFVVLDAMSPEDAGRHWVYEILTYVGRDKVRRP